MRESDFQAFEALGGVLLVLDLDGRIEYWNGACSGLTGYTLAEVRGRRIWDVLVPPEEVQSAQAAFASRLAAGSSEPFATTWVTKSGERRWLGWSDRLTRDSDGQAQYLIQTGIDLTREKRTEEDLRASEARWSGMINLAMDAIISLDADQRITVYNAAAERMFGWSAAEVVGQPLDRLLPERYRPIHREHVDRFGRGPVPARHMGERQSKVVGLRKNGEEFPAEASISRLDMGGRTQFTATLRDVTERTQRERDRKLLAEIGAALSITLDDHATLAEIARLVVQDFADACLVDLVGRDGKLRRMVLVHRDPTKPRLWNGPRDRNHSGLVSTVMSTRQSCLIAEIAEADLDSIATGEDERRALAELAPHSLIVVPLVARGGPLGGLVLLASGSSQRYRTDDLRLAEEVAHRAAQAIENERLYDSTRQATEDLREANQQMVYATIRAQELTEQAEAARARAEARERELKLVAEFRELFIGIVGHDLRNPLASIGVASTLLQRRGRLTPDDAETVAQIILASERMSKIIAQLLDLTRARLGAGFPLERRPTDLGAVCRNIIAEFAAPIRLEVEGDLTGMWDPDRLGQVLSNITGNAIEHAEPGSSVVITARGHPDEVVVETKNQGDPIPADLLPLIFEPFRRAKFERPGPTANLGLGLYIAKQIVLAEGGTLEARSADRTTTFVIRLPRNRPQAITDLRVTADYQPVSTAVQRGPTSRPAISLP